MMKMNILTLLVSVLAVMSFGFVRAEDSDVDEQHVVILGDSNFTTTLGSTKFALVRVWQEIGTGTPALVDRDCGLGFRSRHVRRSNSVAVVVTVSYIIRIRY